jgi:branched-chain amino acid transport system ATP-binding protein
VNHPSPALLRIENLEVSYGAVQVLWGVSLRVNKGQVACLIGSNGAGKSTTLNAVAGVLKAKAGKIFLREEELSDQPPRERVKRRITLVPEGRQLWPKMSVEENLLMGAFPPRFRKNADASLARVYEMFPRLKERRTQVAGTLSGGEQQMCAIGRGLMADPELLMLDEPTLGLAPKAVDEIFEFVRNIQTKGVTVLLVAQNVNYALKFSEYGYLVETGKITLEGPSASLLRNQYVQQAYLGSS